MINLLPHSEKKELERAYYMRVVTLYVLVLVCIMLSGLAMLVPLYTTSIAKKQLIEIQVQALHSQKNTTKEELNSIISEINTKLAVFKDPAKQFSFSRDVVLPVMEQQNTGINITTISYSLDTPKAVADSDAPVVPVKNILVAGTAKDRASLLLFQNRLKGNHSFTGVNVPISNFVVGSNINFNIQFKLTIL